MTNAPGSQATPPGWYTDPQGGPVSRWWDGSQWTEHVQNAYVPPALLKAPEGTAPYTPFIWILALSPLVSLVTYFTFDWAGYLRRYFESTLNTVTSNSYTGMSSIYQSLFTPAYFILLISGWVLYGLSVLFAYFDFRSLRNRGVPKPFHFAFTFLGSIVYVIGRSVVARRRIGRGIAPMWVYIGLTVAVFIISFVIVLNATFALVGVLSQYQFPTNG
jgi:Protein of unknown function (DUF2510)